MERASSAPVLRQACSSSTPAGPPRRLSREEAERPLFALESPRSRTQGWSAFGSYLRILSDTMDANFFFRRGLEIGGYITAIGTGTFRQSPRFRDSVPYLDVHLAC